MSETDISTKAVSALLDGVTAGPWHVEDDWNVHCGGHSVMHGSVHVVSDAESEANANFTAAARDLVPALLADRDRLAAEVDRLREALEFGVNLIRGEAVGSEWKKGCAEFVKRAHAARREGEA